MHRILRLAALFIATSLLATIGLAQQPASEHNPANSAPEVRFAVIGDQGTGLDPQLEVARQMVAEHDRSPFSFVLTLGDNLYGGNWEKRHKLVFEAPYKPLLDRGVVFYATLGNHDVKSTAEQMRYPLFNMNGDSKYSVKPAGELVEFFTFDSTPLSERKDASQLQWLDEKLSQSKADWKILFCHHPPYSPGKRHGDDKILVDKLVPILRKNGVRIVMTGHEHFFAALKPIDGINYIISGSAGKIHKGGLNPKDARLEFGDDTNHHFLSVKLTAETFEYSAIAGSGAVIFRGTIPRTQSAAAGGTR
ncbi:MAG: metallophosphoesterase [Acidobacteria bacterium]|nr:metallophosphoesterase [Acidobacteriota bacterium]